MAHAPGMDEGFEGFGERGPTVEIPAHHPHHHRRHHEDHGRHEGLFRRHKVLSTLGAIVLATGGTFALFHGAAPGHRLSHASEGHRGHQPELNGGAAPGGNHLGLLTTATATPEQSPLATAPAATETATSPVVVAQPTHTAVPPPRPPVGRATPTPVRTTPAAPSHTQAPPAQTATATPLWECAGSTETPDPAPEFTNWLLEVKSGTLTGHVVITSPDERVTVSQTIRPVSATDKYPFAFGNVDYTPGDADAHGFSVTLTTNAGNFSHTFNEC